MIDVVDALEIHQILIDEFGGLAGVRDESLLLAALQRPYTGFAETLFYPTPAQKAGAILESIVRNHPFIDGNKRTGYTLMRLILLQNGVDIVATQDEKYTFVIQVAAGRLTFGQIVDWITDRMA